MYTKHRIKWSCPRKFPFSFLPVSLSLWHFFFSCWCCLLVFSSFLFILYPTWEFVQRIVFYYLWHHDFVFFIIIILEDYCERKGKEYSCGCEKTCVNPSGSCDGPCKKDCFCKRGEILNTRGECVANSNCGCVYQGKEYKVSPICPCYIPWEQEWRSR